MEFRLAECLVLVLLAGTVSGARTPTHSVTAYCLRDDVANTMEMGFSLALNNDLKGDVVARDSAGNVACSADDSDSGYWRRTSTVNIGTSTGNLPCGVVLTVDINVNVYTWRFYYREKPNGEAEVDGGKNRVYTIICRDDSATNNRVTASIMITTPDLEQVVTPWKPDVSMQVLYENNGNFIAADSATQVPVGTPLKLQLIIDYGIVFSPIKPYGIAGLLTETAADSQFTTQLEPFFDSNGCQESTIFAPAQGYAKTDSGSTTGVFKAQTGEFAAWLFQSGNFIHFRTTFALCTATQLSSVALCENACAANTGTGRRRRSTGGDELELVTSIRIYDDTKDAGKEKSAGSLMPALLGASIAGGVVLIVLVTGLLCLASRRRRNADKDDRKVPKQGLENKMYSAY